MGVPAAGTVVLIPFPFSDLNPYADEPGVELISADLDSGSLQRTSYARPGKLCTANSTLIVGDAGLPKAATANRIIEAAVAILRGIAKS